MGDPISWRRGILLSLAGTFAAGTLGPGCSSDPGSEAREQFLSVLKALERGKLDEAYEMAIPAAFDRELNDVLSRAQALLGEEDLPVLRGRVERAVNLLSAGLTARAAGEPALGAIAAKIKGLPGALGLEDYAVFRSRDVKSLLLALEENVFRDVVRIDAVRRRIASVDVAVEAAKNDWVKLRFTSKGSPGGAADDEDRVEVVKKDGKWIPVGWVADWPRLMEGLRARIDDLALRKTQDAGAMKNEIASLGDLIEAAAPAVDGFLTKVGAAGG